MRQSAPTFVGLARLHDDDDDISYPVVIVQVDGRQRRRRLDGGRYPPLLSVVRDHLLGPECCVGVGIGVVVGVGVVASA